MAWTRGPGNVASININTASPTILGGFIENYSSVTETQNFTSALGFEAERGYVTIREMFTNLDVSAITALNTLMQNGTLVPVINTYAGGATKTVTNCRVRIKPIFNVVPDACRVYARAKSTGYDNLASTWTDLGPIIGSLNASFDYPFDGADGCGRPYFSNGRIETEFQLVGDSTVTDPYTDLDTLDKQNVDVAFQMPDGNFMVLKDVYLYRIYGDESTDSPRFIRVKVKQVVANWTALIDYTDGASGALTDNWGTTTNSIHPTDMFAGCEGELVGTGYAEEGTDRGPVTWA